MTATVTTRIEESLLHELDKLSNEKQMDRATFLRNLIKKGVNQEKQKFVLNDYKNRKISLQKAAELLDNSLIEMLDLIKRANITLDYTNEELKVDLKGL